MHICDCLGICIPYEGEGEESKEIYHNLTRGKLTTSIVTVVKHTDYRPERCMKNYLNPDKK
jgi:hypothetical protein